MLSLSIMDGPQQKFGLHDSIGFYAIRGARLIERRVDAGLKDFGLTRIGWCIMLAVEDEGLKNPSDIADFVGIDRTATSRALRGLEADGFVSRKIGQHDRRTTEVTLTKAGYERMMDAVPICAENMDHFNKKLSPDELAELKRLLNKLSQGEQGEADQ